jgi:hypothetical protein
MKGRKNRVKRQGREGKDRQKGNGIEHLKKKTERKRLEMARI